MSVEENQSWVKLAAVEEARSISDVRARLLDEHSHAFRWLTASLLAINAGAAVAALNSEYLSAEYKILSGGLFGLGLLAALLIGVSAQRENRKLLPVLQRKLGYWIAVADDGERLESLEAELDAEIKATVKWAWTGPAIGWISALIFLSGISAMGFGLVDKERELKKDKVVQLKSDSRKTIAAPSRNISK